MPTSKTVSSVERAIKILEALDVSHRGLNISEMSRKLAIPKSTAHVIVQTLERVGYITRNDGLRNYTLGVKVFNLGHELMRNLHLPETALEPMKWLTAKTQLTSHLAVKENEQVLFVQKVDGPGFIRFDTRVGKRSNLHCTALGKVLLAYGDESHRREFLAKVSFIRYTRRTLVSANRLRVELARTVERGYAVDDQEEELDVRCIGVPVFSPTGELLAALSVTGTTGQITTGKIRTLADLLAQASSRITSLVGTSRAVTQATEP